MHPTIEPGDLVVAADGSRHAERAVTWAAEQAALERRRLVVVTADNSSAETINADAVRQARALAPTVEVVGLTAVGDPRVVLVELSQHAGLVVLGSRGRGTIRSMLLGSVSTTVSRLAFCPVVICRPHAAEHRGNGVLAGIDDSADSLAVLEFAFAQASLRRQPLTVVHCVWDVLAAVSGHRNVSIEDADLGADDEAHLTVAEAVAGFTEKYPDVPVTQRVVHGLVDEVLGNRTAAWDLVVVGRHPIDSLERAVTGSIATAVVERAHTDVVVVPAPLTARQHAAGTDA